MKLNKDMIYNKENTEGTQDEKMNKKTSREDNMEKGQRGTARKQKGYNKKRQNIQENQTLTGNVKWNTNKKEGQQIKYKKRKHNMKIKQEN